MTTVGAVADHVAREASDESCGQNKELDRTCARIRSVFGVSEQRFRASDTSDAATCRVVATSILMHHLKLSRAVVREYVGLTPRQVADIDAVFRGFYIIYSVPPSIDIAALASRLAEFFRGKEERIQFTTFKRRPALSVVSSAPEINLSAVGQIRAIARAACDFLMVPLEAVLDTSQRTPNVVLARRLSMYGARRITAESFPVIALYLGGCNHTAVLYTCRQMERALAGEAPREGIGIGELLEWVADRLPDVRAHRTAALRLEKQQRTFYREIAA